MEDRWEEKDEKELWERRKWKMKDTDKKEIDLPL